MAGPRNGSGRFVSSFALPPKVPQCNNFVLLGSLGGMVVFLDVPGEFFCFITQHLYGASLL